MHLTPREIDKLMLHQAGVLAQKRLARGLRLNYVEAVSLITTQLLEFIRDGRSVAELMDLGRRILDFGSGDQSLRHKFIAAGYSGASDPALRMTTWAAPRPNTVWRRAVSLGRLNSSPIVNMRNTTPNSAR